MLIVALKESVLQEKRVAITPEIAKKYSEIGYQVAVENNSGKESGYSNTLYEKAGADIEKNRHALLQRANIILTVSPLGIEDIGSLKPGAILIGLLKPYQNRDHLTLIAESQVTSFSLELLPRITRAQAMDVLSSQSNLAGYKAVIEAAREFGRALPLMMTAAGTIPAARVLVLGAGVAGLQAIATAKRLGAIVSAFDVRSAVKEQVQSLGAVFVDVDIQESGDAQGGYATEMGDAYKKAQAEKLAETIKNQDIIITTAQIPGKTAPQLITADMVKTMKPGSIIVDLAAETGGNCADTICGQTVVEQGVTIMGPANILNHIATDASQLYSRNIFHFIKNLLDENHAIAWQDEIVTATALTHGGKVIHPHFASL